MTKLVDGSSMQISFENMDLEILGFGSAVPEGSGVSNVDLLRLHPETQDKPEAFLVGLSERIFSQYGFSHRYLTRLPGTQPSKKEATSESLALSAVKKALAGRAPSAFILGSTTSSRYTGSQATAILGQLGIEAPAFEIKAGCSTSLASLHLATALLSQGYPDVLVACGETLSKLIHPQVRETWFGLADGAAAIWLKRSSTGRLKIQRAFYSTDGRAVDLFTTPGVLPPTIEALQEGGYYLQGDGQELMKQALFRYSQVVEALMPLSPRWFLPHQVNRKIINHLLAEKNLPEMDILWDADRVGNLGGTSILYSLVRALTENRLADGGEMLLASVGGGLSFAGQVWRWK